MPKPKVRLLVESDAATHVGGAHALQELVAGWGLKPYRRAKGFSFYAVAEIETALQRKKEPHES